jgi:hypothetical protein
MAYNHLDIPSAPIQTFPGVQNVTIGPVVFNPSNIPTDIKPEPIQEEVQIKPAPAEEEREEVFFKKPEKKIKYQNLGYIETEDEELARETIKKSLGFEPLRPAGWQLCVKIYERDDNLLTFIDENGKKKTLVRAEKYMEHDKYTSMVGLVISMGPWAYTDKRFVEHWALRLARFFFGKWMKPSKKYPWCKVGDFVLLPRYEGVQFSYKDATVMYIADDKILGPVQDPRDIKRT